MEIFKSVKADTTKEFEKLLDSQFTITQSLVEGKIIEGVVTKIMDYGCFVKIEEGVEGLIHSSELDWTNKNIKPSKVLSTSQKIKFINIKLFHKYNIKHWAFPGGIYHKTFPPKNKKFFNKKIFIKIII